MADPSFNDLRKQYQALLAQLDSGAITDDQFIQEAQKLNTRDPAGNIWGIEARSGQFMIYTENGWEFREAPTESSFEAQATSTLIKNPGCRKTMGIITLVSPPVFALVWFVYSSLSPGSEGWDCLTPLIIGGLPVLLLLLQRPIDALLRPIQGVRKNFPKLVLTGAALALPFVLGILCSQTAGTEYRGIRLTLVFSILGAYGLLRDPEVQR